MRRGLITELTETESSADSNRHVRQHEKSRGYQITGLRRTYMEDA